MERCGDIIAIEGEYATVRVKLINSCSSSCENYGICKKHEEDIVALNKINAKVGERVKLEYENGPYLLFAFITFWLPIILAGGFAWLMWALTSSELFTVIGGVFGFILSVISIFITNRIIKKKEKIAIITEKE